MEEVKAKTRKRKSLKKQLAERSIELGVAVIQAAITGLVFGLAQGAGSRAFSGNTTATANDTFGAQKETLPLKRLQSS